MDYYLERLENEIKRIFNFWTRNFISPTANSVNVEMNYDGSSLNCDTISSIFLHRVIFGASAACRFLEKNDYKPLADISYKFLYENFKNPSGGYYWLLKNGLHSSNNKLAYLAQAYALHGLSEYAMLTKDPLIVAGAKKQYSFITTTFKSKAGGYFMEGWYQDWVPNEKQPILLSTQMGTLMALRKYHEFSNDENVVQDLRELIHSILTNFVNKDSSDNIFFSKDLTEPSKKENNTGAIAQLVWLLISTSNQLGDNDLTSKCWGIGKPLLDNIISDAFDRSYGGIFTLLNSNELKVHEKKVWWVQAEVAIAVLQAYQISRNKIYLSYAIRLIEYIENTFSDEKYGEWYDQVSREGIPDKSIPKVHEWKALYHNIRYCIEVSKRLKNIINNQYNNSSI